MKVLSLTPMEFKNLLFNNVSQLLMFVTDKSGSFTTPLTLFTPMFHFYTPRKR